MKLLRWLSCRTGHHRETVTVGPFAVALICLDCWHVEWLSEGVVRTPSRRYALKRTA